MEFGVNLIIILIKNNKGLKRHDVFGRATAQSCLNTMTEIKMIKIIIYSSKFWVTKKLRNQALLS